jgi:hypothetical protein
MQVKGAHGVNVGNLCATLQKLTAYPPPLPSSGPENRQLPFQGFLNKYIPPYARTIAHGSGPPAATQADQQQRQSRVPGSNSMVREWSSDSEGSDCEGRGSNGPAKGSRVRLAALACIQLLTKADPKALQPCWIGLLPMTDVVSTCTTAHDKQCLFHLSHPGMGTPFTIRLSPMYPLCRSPSACHLQLPSLCRMCCCATPTPAYGMQQLQHWRPC